MTANSFLDPNQLEGIRQRSTTNAGIYKGNWNGTLQEIPQLIRKYVTTYLQEIPQRIR